MPNNRWLCAYATVLLLLALAGGCATPNRDAYVPAVASPPKEPLNREARVARAKALEFPTEYVAPPGDPMSHHAAALARVVCAAVFISGLDADFAVANAGAMPPFDVRKDLGKPVVDLLLLGAKFLSLCFSKRMGCNIRVCLLHRRRYRSRS